MKNILKTCTIYFFIGISLISCNDEKNAETLENSKTALKANWVEVGVLEDGLPKIIGDKEALIASWTASLLKNSQIRASFSDVYVDGVKGDYQLVFKGTKYQSGFYVTLVDSNRLIAIGDTACTTTACSQENRGCVVKYDQGEPGYCSPCANGGACTKTTSNKAMISFAYKKPIL